MSEKLTADAIEEMVVKAKDQAARMIESVFRQVVADFEKANNDGFKLTLNIEGERKGRDASLTLQTKAETKVDIKRKDQTQAEVIDWGPTLFDKGEGEDLPPDEEEAPRGPKLLPSASPVFDPEAVDAEFTVEDGNPEEAAPGEDEKAEEDQTEDDIPEDADDGTYEEEPADETPNN